MKKTQLLTQRVAVGLTWMAVIFLALACGGETDETVTTSGEKQLWTCGMHPQVILEEPGNCPICGMKLVPMKSETGGAETAGHRELMEDLGIGGDREATVTIDPVTVQNMGVRTAVVKRQPFSRIIRTVGHVDYNEDRLSTVNLKFSGWIEKLHVERTGERVSRGEPLLKVYAPDLVATQEEYLLAYRNYQRLANSPLKAARAGARDLLNAARQRLQNWDITDEQIAELERIGKLSKTLTIHAPTDGMVIHKNAVEGTHARAGEDLFGIADLSEVWVLAHIFEYELPWIRVGQRVQMELPYIPGKRFVGQVDYIYPYLDAKTRDVKIRLVFDNPRLELKPQMYANITIESKAGDNELVIPNEAIIRSGVRNIVFLDLGNGRFRPQEVVVGPEGENGLVKIIEGLEEGQRIVTSAQFLVDSESRLREAIQKMLETKTSSTRDHQH